MARKTTGPPTGEPIARQTVAPRARRRQRRIHRRARAMSAEVVRYLRTETIGGLILLVATAVALLVANSPLAAGYQRVRDTTVGPAALHLDLTIGTWATDGLLAVFFVVAGLELKRELVVGQLRQLRGAMLPVFGALGGMVVPALVCLAVGWGAPGGSDAWAVPVATDIAFALAVLAVTASQLPASVRVFLLTLAIVDDLGAITLIAVVYTDHVAWLPLLLGAAAIACYALLQWRGVRFVPLYVALAVAAWMAIHASGIHATVAGVAIGLATRIQVRRGEQESPAEQLEHKLQPFSAGVCVPLFAFFAAGVALDGDALRALAADRVAWAVIAGLVVGKFVGVLGGATLAVRLRLAHLPHDLHWHDLAAVSALAGCGFTVSLLITELAFGGTDAAPRIKAAVLLASLTASLFAASLLRIRVKARRP